MKENYYNRQRGFSFVSVILAILAVVVVIGVWGFSGQGTLNSSGNINPSIQASAIMNEGSNIKAEFDRLVLKGSSPKSIVFVPNVASTGAAPNILDTVSGIQNPPINKNLIRVGAAVPEGIWVYNNSGFYVNKTNSFGGADQVIMLSGIKSSVCKNINKSLHNTETIPVVTSKANSSAFVTGATTATPTSAATVDLSSIPVANNWNSGCISANGVPDNNLYFLVLKGGLCGPAPSGTRTNSCPDGYSGSWTQTQTYSAAPAPTCWNSSGWLPTSAPAGACTYIPPSCVEDSWTNNYSCPANHSGEYSSVTYVECPSGPYGSPSYVERDEVYTCEPDPPTCWEDSWKNDMGCPIGYSGENSSITYMECPSGPYGEPTFTQRDYFYSCVPN